MAFDRPAPLELAGDALGPGDRSLFAALRAEAVPAEAERWRELCEAALRLGVAPLLHAELSRSRGLREAPEEVAVRLGRARAWSRARWSRQVGQVEELGRGLRRAGVDALVVKGAHVGHLYADPGARTCGDVDLVVRPDRVGDAAAALERLGYAQAPPRPWDLEHPGHRHLPAFHRADVLPVELHHTLGEAAEATGWAEGAWTRAEPLGDTGLLTMSALDALLYTCKHLAVHHRFSTANAVAALADVRVLVERVEEDAVAVAARADAWGIRAAAGLCVLLARDLLGATVADDLLRATSAPGAGEAAASAVFTMLHLGALGLLRPLRLPGRATLVPAPTVTGVGSGHPVRSLWAFARTAGAPPLDDLRLEYPALGRTPLAPLGYPALWVRLGWRHLGWARWLDPRTRRAARARAAHHEAVLRRHLGADA